MSSLFSKTGIANKALLKIGAKRISDLDDSNDPNVTSINDIYDSVRQEVLSEAPWSFAIQQVALTSLTLAATLPALGDGINYAYGLPSDFLEIYMLSVPCQYRIQMLQTPYVTSPTLALLSDQSTLAGMRYIFDNDDPTTYGAKFYEAMACKLALELCFKVSEAQGMVDRMAAAYAKALLSAISWDANTSIPDQAVANEWFIARLAGSGVVSGLPNGNIGFFPDPYSPDF